MAQSGTFADLWSYIEKEAATLTLRFDAMHQRLALMTSIL